MVHTSDLVEAYNLLTHECKTFLCPQTAQLRCKNICPECLSSLLGNLQILEIQIILIIQRISKVQNYYSRNANFLNQRISFLPNSALSTFFQHFKAISSLNFPSDLEIHTSLFLQVNISSLLNWISTSLLSKPSGSDAKLDVIFNCTDISSEYFVNFLKLHWPKDLKEMV